MGCLENTDLKNSDLKNTDLENTDLENIDPIWKTLNTKKNTWITLFC